MASPRILIVDDEEVICTGCSMILGERGHLVDYRLTGRSGLEAVRCDAYDVILLDMKLPDMGGMEILRQIREEQPGVRVIVMTGYSTVENAVGAMKLGAYDYLAKPFSDDDLILSVEKAIEDKRLAEENQSLKEQRFERYEFSNIVGENAKLLRIFDEIRKVAPTEATVLLEGESGTGKELFARAIHAHSLRSARQFVAVDLSTLSSSLLESELFGHVRGAFTGAEGTRAGVFEAADGGTLFLDEIANLGMETQGKLLRVMENQEFKAVGDVRSKKTDVRIIAATNRNLEALVEHGDFREDLFYRLNVLPILIPPLRERKEDIPKLAYHFLRLYCRKTDRRIRGFTDDALKMLIEFGWPGNVRQLKNVVERLVIMSDGDVVQHKDLFDYMHGNHEHHRPSLPLTITELKEVKRSIIAEQYGRIEKEFLMEALSQEDGNITRAAARTGMQRSNFSALMKKHGLSKPMRGDRSSG